MIKFLAGDIVGFGLSQENVKRLKLGQPILVKLRDMGLDSDLRVTIIYGETEAEMYHDLKRAGLISEDTQIRIGKIH